MVLAADPMSAKSITVTFVGLTAMCLKTSGNAHRATAPYPMIRMLPGKLNFSLMVVLVKRVWGPGIRVSGRKNFPESASPSLATKKYQHSQNHITGNRGD